MADLDSLIGCKISLISHQDIRYDGTLFSINQTESSIVLKDVKAFGTEDRVTDKSKSIPPSSQVLPFLTFPGTEIKDLFVHETTPAPEAPLPTPPAAEKPAQKPKSEKPKHHKSEQQQQVQPPKPPAVEEEKPKETPKSKEEKDKSKMHGVGTGSHLLKLKEKKTGENANRSVDTSEFNFEESLKTFNKEEVLAGVANSEEAKLRKYIKDDFFDNLSNDVVEGKPARLSYSEERHLNQDTFGAIALQRGRGYGRGRGRGGRGGRSSGRGGRGGRSNNNKN